MILQVPGRDDLGLEGLPGRFAWIELAEVQGLLAEPEPRSSGLDHFKAGVDFPLKSISVGRGAGGAYLQLILSRHFVLGERREVEGSLPVVSELLLRSVRAGQSSGYVCLPGRLVAEGKPDGERDRFPPFIGPRQREVPQVQSRDGGGLNFHVGDFALGAGFALGGGFAPGAVCIRPWPALQRPFAGKGIPQVKVAVASPTVLSGHVLVLRRGQRVLGGRLAVHGQGQILDCPVEVEFSGLFGICRQWHARAPDQRAILE